MAEGTSKTVNDLSNCCICLEEFKSPKSLPCLHKFCQACLTTYIKKHRRGNRLDCPLCRRNVGIPRERFQGFSAKEAKKTESVQVYCDICEEIVDASRRCIDCEENMCEVCVKFHSRMKVSRGHKVIEIPLDTKTHDRSLGSYVFCEDHPDEKVQFVCIQCNNELLCSICNVKKHEQHRMSDLLTVAGNMLRDLSKSKQDRYLTGKERMQPRRSLDPTIAQCLHNYAEEETTDISKLEIDVKLVQEQSVLIHSVIDKTAKLLEDFVRSQHAAFSTLKQWHRSERENRQAVLSAIYSNFQTVLERGSPAEIVKKGTELQEVLKPLKPFMGTWETPRFFTKSTIEESVVLTMFGVTRNVFKELKAENLELIKRSSVNRFESTFRSASCGHVQGIVQSPSNPNHAWVLCWNSQMVHLIDTEGNCTESVNIETPCHYIATKNGVEFAVSCHADRCIKEVTFEEKTKHTGKHEYMVKRNILLSERLDVHPHGIAFRKTSKVDQDLIYTCSQESFSGAGSTKIKVHGIRGFNEMERQCEENKKPMCIAIDPVVGTVCIGNVMDNQITVYDSELRLISETYNGDIDSPQDVNFYNPSCIVVVNEEKNILTMGLDCRVKNVLMSGKSFHCVAFDDQGRMWVGLNNGVVELFKIK